MPKLSKEIIDKIILMKQHGFSSRTIASTLNVGKTTVNENWAKHLQQNPSGESEDDWLTADVLSDWTGDDYDKAEIVFTSSRKKGPRILFFDLESTPSIVAAFKRWKVNIGTESVVTEGGYILSACWKFLGDEEVTQMVLTPDEAIDGDDSRIICALFEAFEQADVVVAHNGKRFDIPLFKTRLIANNMPPPKTVKVVDTLEIAKRLKFNSNKLDSLGHYMNIGRKIETTGMSLWLRCMDGDEQALADMVRYNAQDVTLLEQVYLKLRAFDPSAPNAGLFYNDHHEHCPVCGSTHVEQSGNSVFTNVSEFVEIVCNDCGHRSRKRIALNSKQDKNKLLMTAR